MASPDSIVIPRALGAEVGVRHYWAGGTLATALWGTDLQSELVYNGDEGTTEPSGRTRRYGLDLEARIPLAPEVTSTGGLTVRDVGPVNGGLRYRHIGARAADQADSVIARGYTIVELFGTWQISRVRLIVTLDNLLDTAWNEAQFATTSRLQGEPGPVTELNFTPGAPRTIQVGVDYRF